MASDQDIDKIYEECKEILKRLHKICYKHRRFRREYIKCYTDDIRGQRRVIRYLVDKLRKSYFRTNEREVNTFALECYAEGYTLPEFYMKYREFVRQIASKDTQRLWDLLTRLLGDNKNETEG